MTMDKVVPKDVSSRSIEYVGIHRLLLIANLELLGGASLVVLLKLFNHPVTSPSDDGILGCLIAKEERVAAGI